jgi:hypothetical protein
MDYPHPVVSLNKKGEIDLTGSYDNKIGEWDKVAITWGYADLRNSKNEEAALNKILTDAAKRGLKFISDRDARAPGGMHPEAHLWDNGADPVEELARMNKVREKALSQFGLQSIPAGTPMAMLEDVLVPVYFHHRYQLEAATKIVGGLNYNYALKGDGQMVTTPVTAAQQEKAMKAILECMDPSFLKLPASITSLIPPRPAGYEFTRELFKKKTGLSFDELAPAEAAADMPLSFLFHPERINRLVQQEFVGGYGYSQMIDALVTATFKAKRRSGIEAAIQLQNEQLLLTYMLAASVDEKLSFPSKASVVASVNGLKNAKKSADDATYKAHLDVALERCKSPEKAKPTLHAIPPPGAPIGCSEAD